MRMIWVKAGKLLPVDTGGKIRSYNILRHLAQRHEVIVFSYYPGARDAEYERELQHQFPGAEAVALGAPGGALQRAMHYALRFPQAAPYSITKYTAPSVRARLAELMRDRKPQVAICDFLTPSLNFAQKLSASCVLFQHNVESALWRRQAQYEKNPVKRGLFWIEAKKMYRYERATIKRFRGVIAVSEHDRALMLEMVPDADVTVVPTGVDLAHFRRPTTTPSSRPIVLFLGSMDWPANIDGVEFFCADVWPRVVAAVPDAVFQVVGRNPPPRIRRLASESVEIVGGVESVLPHLHGATVFVVPLRIGGGTRLKIYEAMAAGLPIVSTAVGAEGLDVTDGRDVLFADDPEPFADAVIDLLKDEERRTSIADAALTTAQRFDWSAIATSFESVLDEAVADRR